MDGGTDGRARLSKGIGGSSDFELLWWGCGEETGRSCYLSKQSWGRTTHFETDYGLLENLIEEWGGRGIVLNLFLESKGVDAGF